MDAPMPKLLQNVFASFGPKLNVFTREKEPGTYVESVASRSSTVPLLSALEPMTARASSLLDKKALAAMDKSVDYRRLIEAKLASLGVAPAEDAADKGAAK